MSRKSVIVWNHQSTAPTAVIGSPLDHGDFVSNDFIPSPGNHVTNHDTDHVISVTNSVTSNPSLPKDFSHPTVQVRSSGWFADSKFFVKCHLKTSLCI